ncbi:helix-turn-helix domain-containing protein [Streptomyces reniochalinae]|uniref:GAF domain-containing protein n=1 Tax=Streptomyces reniochalinae TaxID=2250578 RepID=A0A367EJ75_9ACTN|nr:GAF domain-containing protein [Streptomyces reniochalinae]RCG18101.1 GAF domain-containing protein [Streptomyces reniochalinae]
MRRTSHPPNAATGPGDPAGTGGPDEHAEAGGHVGRAGTGPDDHACLGYLELLTRGAPPEAYDEPAAHAAPAHGGSAAARGKHLALRIRAELEGRRRREAELTGLFETVHDLAGLRDVDDVLQAIVQRARRLLSTEVAYMTLTDPERGDTYMRVTEGSVSARFQQLRLGMGEGLGGLVAQTARPYATQDYPRDARFQHTHPIDSGVGEEGLVAILGVPLLLRGREVIGVLYAADRRERVFDPEQIALLRSFAAHAAVALDNARLLTETTQALAGLRAVNATIRRASDVHDRLTELVLRGGGVPDVTRALAEVLGGAVEFADSGGPATWEAAVARSRRDGHAVRQDDTWVAAVTAGGEPLGALLLHGHPELAPVDQRTLERAAMVTSLLQLARRSAGEAEQRVRGELLDDLLDAAHRDPHLLRDRAARVGADLDVPHTVLAVRLDPPDAGEAGAGGPGPGGAAARGPFAADEDEGDRQRLWSAAGHLAATRHGLAATRDGGPVLLLPLAPPSHSGRLTRSDRRTRSDHPDHSDRPDGPGPSVGPSDRSGSPDRPGSSDRPARSARPGSSGEPASARGSAPRGGAASVGGAAPAGDGEAVSRTARQVAAELGRAVGGPVTVGASAPVPAPADLPGAVAAAYPEARRCLDALSLLGRRGEGAAASDLGFLGLLLTDTRDVTGFVHRTLGPVLDYDAQRGTGLVATMDAYFSCGMSPVRAKDVLHVHVNTVAQRLERVARLLGDDWQAPHRTLEIQLALRLHRLAGAVGG